MAFFYYLILRPLSILPSWMLYGISDLILYPIIYLLVGYRKKVVLNNIRIAFPDKSEVERKKIASKFYHHFCDLMVESIMLFTISKERAIKRCKLVNPEIFQPFYDAGKSIALVGGHYNNWELLAVAIAPQIIHQVDGIYTPLTNPFMEKKMKASRSKYGLRMVPKKESAAFIEKTKDEKTCMIFAIDQAPFRKQKAYWMKFFDRETAVAFGTERYAIKNDWPVLFCHLRKVKRGYYEMEIEVVSDRPQEEPYGMITQKHTRIIENDIKANPEFWLWTHKRWKRKRPEGEALQPSLL
jgi:KDO2-lipid IV(A) lauroyltransferase